MNASFAFRIDTNGKHWGGNNSPQGDKQQRRRQKLQDLLQSLKAGDLDAARLAFTALINFDPSIAGDPWLNKIGSALQSSNLNAAQHYGLELRSRGLQPQSYISASDAHINSRKSDSLNTQTGSTKIDFFA